jgi:NADH-quinone oxidoreductase subunit C
MLVNKDKLFYLLSQKSNILLKLLKDDIYIKSNDIITISKYLKKLEYLLITTTAIDQLQKINRFLIYNVLVNYNIGQRIYLSINTNLKTNSITDIFPSAIWLEREVYDLFGIYFISKSKTNDLRRILTDYNFKGHPLRKDFSLIGYNEKFFSYRTKTIRNRKDFSF